MAKNQLKLACLSGALLLGLGSSAAMAEGATAEMLANTCAGCHGTHGNSVGPASPTIAGMDPVVFADTMEAFKSGDTYSTIMGRIAKGYESEDFEKMGEYFKQQEYKPAKQEFDASLADKGAKLHDKYCEKCHAEGGKVLPDEEDYNILAGQWVPYMKNAMTDFRDGNRDMPKKMKKKLDKMLKDKGDESLDALWAFYASQQ